MDKEKPIIGVIVHNDLYPFKAMINSLFQSTNYFERLIIIESESTDGCKEYCNRIARANKNIEVINTKKEGPLKAYNILFKIARDENKDLLLTQSDVVFPALYQRDWLKGMSQIANNEDIGIVVPINGGGISGDTYLDKFYWVGGWCTLFSKKCWELVEGFDENYPKGYGVDIKMTYLINQKYRTHQVNYWVDHHMMNAREHDSSPDSEKAKKEAARMFREEFKLGEYKE